MQISTNHRAESAHEGQAQTALHSVRGTVVQPSAPIVTRGLTEAQMDALRNTTNKLSILVLFIAGQKEKDLYMKTEELHTLFEEPWLALREIVQHLHAK